MKTLLLTWLGICLVTTLPAQPAVENPPETKLTASELNELLGPIALYPDALIALILPAATVPADVVLGARFIAADGNPGDAESKPWDSSVKALTRYPETLRWLDENLEWTTQVGDAFIEQPVEVMESIQQLRAKARALGNLVDTPQQRIFLDDANIRIIPADADYIYEPRYDSEVIYYDRPLNGPLLLFGQALGIGAWLSYDCDWRHHRLFCGEWHRGWDYTRDGNHRDREEYLYINNKLTNSREWHPDPARRHPQSRFVTKGATSGRSVPGRTQSGDPVVGASREHHAGIARPKAIAGASHRDETIRRAEPVEGSKIGNQPSAHPGHTNKLGDDHNGRAAMPKSAAPGIAGENRHDTEARDHKKPANEPEHAIRRSDAPSKKDTEGKAHVESPRHEPAKKEEPKHQDTTKHDAPPKHDAAPKHDAPPKHEEAAKHKDAPRHEPEKPHSDSGKGKKGDKKDDDKKK